MRYSYTPFKWNAYSFVHTYRSELASAQVNGQTYAYDYDNIGNRRMSIDASDYAFYDANELEQYSSIRKNEESAFVPTFYVVGNQTLVRTVTGTWSVSYNAENRPVIFQKNTDSVITRITCTYDYMGRRATKKVEEITTDAEGNETTAIITYHRFIYRGYLQIGCCDLTRANHPCLWLITWDPTDGRWINRDPIAEQGGRNLYGFVGNKLKAHVVLGLDAPGYEGAQAITIIIDIQEKSRRIDRNHILGLPKGGWSLGITDLIPDFIESINNRIHNNFF